MHFLRLLLVVIGVTACGGLFGATVGALMGYATPSALEVVFDVELQAAAAEADVARTDDASEGGSVAIAASGDKSLTMYGASLGASFGLIAGAILGIGIAVLDQLILTIGEWNKRRS